MASQALAPTPPKTPATPTRSVHGPCKINELAACRLSEWDGYVLDHPDGTVFHTIAWRNAVRDSFPHEHTYLTAIRDERIVGVLPLFLVDSRIGGRMLVSVPYGVGGGIIADEDETALTLFEAAKRIAIQRRCKIIDLRSERAVVPEIPVMDRYVGFRRALPQDAGAVLGWLPRKARAAARNARNKYRLEVSFGDQHLREVWRLYTLSMRRLGSLTYPLRFFEQLLAHTRDRHWVSLARRDGRPVAGLVTFLFRDCVIPYFIGTTGEAKRCSASNFLYLTAMERGVDCGYRQFDFGRSRRDNTGSYDFKRFNGFTPRSLQYQTYTLPGSHPPDLSPTNPKFRVARVLWRHFPLFVTRSVGAKLARHIPG